MYFYAWVFQVGSRLSLCTIRNRIRFCVELLFEPREAHKLQGHTLSAVRDYLFSLFAATVHIAGRSSIRNLRTCLVVLTGTHLSRRKWEDNIKMDLLEV